MLDDEIIVSGSKGIKLLSLPDFPNANLFGAEVYDGNEAGVTDTSHVSPKFQFLSCDMRTLIQLKSGRK